MPQRDFDKKDWIARLGAALEQVAAEARPANFPFSLAAVPNPGPIEPYRREQRRQYRELAALAKRDKHAAQLFDESFLVLKSPPTRAISILREHPVLDRVLSGSSEGGFHWQLPGVEGHIDLGELVPNLAKSAVRRGGETRRKPDEPLPARWRAHAPPRTRDHPGSWPGRRQSD